MKHFNFEDAKIGDRLVADNGEIVTYIGFTNDIPFENKKFCCRRDHTFIKGFCSRHKEEWFDYKGRSVYKPKDEPHFPMIYNILGKCRKPICLKNCKFGDKLKLRCGAIGIFLGKSNIVGKSACCYDIVVKNSDSFIIYCVDKKGRSLDKGSHLDLML